MDHISDVDLQLKQRLGCFIRAVAAFFENMAIIAIDQIPDLRLE